ncbi:trans-sulfuration enzyme family protein [Glycomyces sp. MUSA5-2]|uniref:trans-sulfuration enzyme family protein n=1 Tax=Glycomyces sp. MUSA5-2 TaxID=2053002 RepID=UPI003008BCAE
MSDTRRFATLAVHGGEPRPAAGGSVVFPVFQGTVFETDPGGGVGDAPYSRLGTNPTQRHLHRRLAALEGAEAAVATASGMGAITTALHSVLATGDHLIAAGDFYGGTLQFLTEHAARLGWSFDLVDPGDPDAWRRALRPSTKALLTESITNPLTAVGDLAGAARFAREHGLTSLIDNTLATPVVFRPHAVGFDLVCHSATKALNGHSDLTAGAVTGSRERIAHVAAVLGSYGASLDPHAAFLLARGLKTLALRVSRQNENAQAVAELLAAHDAVAAVRYPGLPQHPDHRRAAALFDGFGSVVTFRPVGGAPAAEAIVKALRLPYAAPSLGGVESLVTRLRLDGAAHGMSGEVVRFSAGIEAAEDLVEDFAQALAQSPAALV